MIAETIENEIDCIIGKYDRITDAAELEDILRISFYKVQEATEQETLKSTSVWICDFCGDEFCGRCQEEAEVVKCRICGYICCKNCMEEHFSISRSRCKDCDEKGDD